MKLFKALLISAIMTLPTACLAVDIEASWSAPTQREDGRAILPAEIASYTINHNGKLISTTETHLTFEADIGENIIMVDAVDTDGLHSEYTDPVGIDIWRLKSPSNVQVTLPTPGQ